MLETRRHSAPVTDSLISALRESLRRELYPLEAALRRASAPGVELLPPPPPERSHPEGPVGPHP